jgi:hypothetical protein
MGNEDEMQDLPTSKVVVHRKKVWGAALFDLTNHHAVSGIHDSGGELAGLGL